MSVAASLALPGAGISSASAAPDYGDYQVVYEVNDFSFLGNTTAYPNAIYQNCVDFIQYPGGVSTNEKILANQCTLKQALTQANGNGKETLITIDADQLENDYDVGCFTSTSTKCGQAYRNPVGAPVINLTGITADSQLMCDGSTRRCGSYDVEAEKAAFEVYTANNGNFITIDFQGMLGISTWKDSSPYYSTIAITSSQVKLLNINGIHSNETAIMIPAVSGRATGDIEIGFGSTENYLNTEVLAGAVEGGWGWAQGNWSTERFLVIQGEHAPAGYTDNSIYLHEWSIGHLYGIDAVNGYGILFSGANVTGFKAEAIEVYSGVSGSCIESDISGCYTSGFYANGTVTLTNMVVDGMWVVGSRSARLPVALAGSGVTINTATFKDLSMSDLRANSVMDFKDATVTALTLTGTNPTTLGYYSYVIADNSVTTTNILNFAGAKVNNLVIEKTAFERGNTTAPCFNFEGAVVNGITVSGNSFRNNTCGTYGVFNFHSATPATTVTKPVAFTNNKFETNIGAQGIINFYQSTGMWLKITGNTFKENYTSSQAGGTNPAWGGQLVLGASGYYLDANSAHGSIVDSNEFTNYADTTIYVQTAIFWRGDVDNASKWGSAKQSNLQITGNTFKGYTGTAIYLRDVGGVLVRYNTFLASNAHAAKGSAYPYFADENINPSANPANSAPRFLLNVTYANQEALPWTMEPGFADSAGYKVSQYQCQATISVDLGINTVTPQIVDYYASANEGIPGTPLKSVTYTVATSLAGMEVSFKLTDVAGKYIRTQVHYQDSNGVWQSSQFSTAALIPNLQCVTPSFTITKKAYSDAQMTIEIPDGGEVSEGQTVYWKYSVTNKLLLPNENLPVIVSDDHYTGKFAPVICTLSVPPGETVSSCTFSQTVTAEDGAGGGIIIRPDPPIATAEPMEPSATSVPTASATTIEPSEVKV
ncbi:MAG: hypothetical protein LBQ92_05540 [Propionibacteriaceae bacterium]|nr:hypothetical protein [Propionibacteriaceae bacterium]